MEYSRIQNMVIQGGSQPQQSLMYINDNGELIMGDNVSDDPVYDCLPFQSADRVLFLDENGYVREGFQDLYSSVIFSHDLDGADDGEIPAHVLDHMYAKKPREPGSEQSTNKPRRKSKRKEQIVEQFVISDPQPQTPKINIIRQRLPTSLYNKSPPSRPKILHGNSPTKLNQIPNVNSTSPGSTRGKVAGTKGNVTMNNSGRTIKKEDSLYSSLDDNGNKYGKDQYSLNRTQKPAISKMNPNTSAIIMDELQSRSDGASGYEEEMLFDFGISEDDDEVITCTLGSEGFSDGVFDEYGVGLEVYTNSAQIQNNNSKSSSLSKSPVTSTVFLNPPTRTNVNNNSAQLTSEISDDDDSNQIMISMINRRPSQEWDSTELVDTKAKVEVNNTPQDFVISTGTFSEIESTSNTESSRSGGTSSPPLSFGSAEVTSGSKKGRVKSPKLLNTLPHQKPSDGPIRRSARAVKTPAWLDDSSVSPISKKKRR